VTSDISDVDLIESYQEATKEDVRQLARVYTRDAIQTLVALMKAPKTPPVSNASAPATSSPKAGVGRIAAKTPPEERRGASPSIS